MTRDELIVETQQARREWDEALAGLSDGDLLTAEISRGWNLKDVIGHLATYLRLNVRHVESYRKRGKIASMRAKNWYQFNKRQVARLKQEPLATLRADLDFAYHELLGLLPQLSDKDLQVSFPSPWSPHSGQKVRLGTILRADVSRHLRAHARDVMKWREGRDVRK
jgi:DinB family protein